MAIPPLNRGSTGSSAPAPASAQAAPTLPTAATNAQGTLSSGVLADRCYGCGRCLPACPRGLIIEREQLLPAAAVAPLLAALRPDAIELHTRIGRAEAFAARLAQVREAGVPLQRLAVSCGLEVEGATGSEDRRGAEPPERLEPSLAAELWNRFAQLRQAGYTPLWQLDGRPMSGDVGAGTARAAVGLLRRIAALLPPGPVQLAGGTNDRTLALVEALSPPERARVVGVAFGSVARARLAPLLLEAQRRGGRLLDQADLLPEACAISRGLVRPWLERRGPGDA